MNVAGLANDLSLNQLAHAQQGDCSTPNTDSSFWLGTGTSDDNTRLQAGNPPLFDGVTSAQDPSLVAMLVRAPNGVVCIQPDNSPHVEPSIHTDTIEAQLKLITSTTAQQLTEVLPLFKQSVARSIGLVTPNLIELVLSKHQPIMGTLAATLLVTPSKKDPNPLELLAAVRTTLSSSGLAQWVTGFNQEAASSGAKFSMVKVSIEGEPQIKGTPAHTILDDSPGSCSVQHEISCYTTDTTLRGIIPTTSAGLLLKELKIDQTDSTTSCCNWYAYLTATIPQNPLV